MYVFVLMLDIQTESYFSLEKQTDGRPALFMLGKPGSDRPEPRNPGAPGVRIIGKGADERPTFPGGPYQRHQVLFSKCRHSFS